MLLSVVNILFCPVILPLNVEGRAADDSVLVYTHTGKCLETVFL